MFKIYIRIIEEKFVKSIYDRNNTNAEKPAQSCI